MASAAAAADVAVAAQKKLLLSLIADDSEEQLALNCLDDDITLMTGEGVLMNQRQSRQIGTTRRIENYVEEVIPRYSPLQFASHFRMLPSSFEKLCAVLAPHCQTLREVTLERKVLATLWLLANQESYRGVADRFNFSKGSLHLHAMNVCHGLQCVMPLFIQFPKPSEYSQTADGFMKRCGFPGVIGAVDGTHVQIPGPSMYRDSYINRKGFPSMHLQVIADSTLKFSDIFTGFSGSVHDSRVFKNSEIGQLLSKGHLPEEYHLIGDSAYALSPYLITPYRDNGHLSQEEKHYNNVHSRTRVDVERSIGRLKGKFRRLRYLDMLSLPAIPSVIAACCVLHNFIILNEPYDGEEFELEDDEPHPLPPTMKDLPSTTAVNKRRNITQLIP